MEKCPSLPAVHVTIKCDLDEALVSPATLAGDYVHPTCSYDEASNFGARLVALDCSLRPEAV